FAPPFYNRPPTPLPPSPSLTSLLRPTFSTANSRPTTPDPSSDENTAPPPRPSIDGAQTPNSTAASTLLRSAKPIPRASPKVPTYEYYGFTLYLTSSLAFIVYLFWSILPSPFLHQLGIYYYPNRWWALAIPAWTVMFIVYIYVALAAYNTGHLTLPLNSVETLVDEAANIAVVDAKGNIRQAQEHARRGSLGRVQGGGELDWRTLWMEGTDAVMDIPVGGVCEILYG
ncbi:PIG-P-domain-containing protein, partial [Teratosphaeria nubilosa]